VLKPLPGSRSFDKPKETMTTLRVPTLRLLFASAVVAASSLALPAASADDVDHRAARGPSAGKSTPKVQLCHGKRATIVGTRGDDVLVGTNGPDVIVGRAGEDRIIAKGGNDWICGKSGYDSLYPGGGADHVEGGQDGDRTHYSAGDDVIDGGLGWSDTLDYGSSPSHIHVDVGERVATVGAAEHDRFEGLEDFLLTRFADRFDAAGADASAYGQRGDDVLVGGPGNDYFDGGPGDDRIDGGRGFDNLKGGTGVDQLIDLHGSGFYVDGMPKHRDRGGLIRTGARTDEFIIYPGKRTIDTGDGDDSLTLRGGMAGSTILTGAGDDSVLFRAPYRSGPMTLRTQDGDDKVACTAIACGGGSDIHGGPGVNSIELWVLTPAVTAVLGPIGSLAIQSDTERTMSLFDFVNITTGDGADHITGSDAANTIVTQGGDDNISALAGDDLVAAGSEDDTADGGDGDDRCYEVESPTNCETTG
jgi:Ca2+-binding RTX toxin-like protein